MSGIDFAKIRKPKEFLMKIIIQSGSQFLRLSGEEIGSTHIPYKEGIPRED